MAERLAVPDLRMEKAAVPEGTNLPVLIPRLPVPPAVPGVDYRRNIPGQEIPRYRRVPNQDTPTMSAPYLTVDPHPYPAPRTFTGADITCVVHVLGNGGITTPVVLANCQTLSYSIHRDKFPVRALGHTYARGYCRGGRTIGGSMVFTMFDREVLWEIIQTYSMDVELNENEMEYSSYSPMLDQLPPFDITVTFQNEYGDVANMAIYGVEIVDEGAVLSVDDLLVEKTVSYIARDIDIVRPYKEAPNFKAFGKDVTTQQVTAEDVNAFMQSLAKRRAAIRGGGGEGGRDIVWSNDIPYDYAIFSAQAKHDSLFPVLSDGDMVMYSTAGVTWIGTAKMLTYDGAFYLFKPSAKIYNYVSADGLYRLHYDMAKTMSESTAKESITAGKIPDKYLMLVNGVEVDREDLRVYGKWTTP